jgi:hypothetical protein
MTRMRWGRRSQQLPRDYTKREPSPEVIERAARRRAQAKAGTGVKIVRDEAGPACPQCGRPTEVRMHQKVTARMKRQRFFYRRWFFCCNPQCSTTTIMRPEDIEWRGDLDDVTRARLAQITQQLRPRR